MTDHSTNPWTPDPRRVAKEAEDLRRFGQRVLLALAGLALAVVLATAVLYARL